MSSLQTKNTLMSGDVDPNVKIPPAILRTMQAADQLHKQAYETPDAPEGDAPAEPVAEATTQSPTFNTPEPQPATPVTPQVTDADDASWKHRYESMKGRFDKAQENIRAMSEQIRSMQATMAALQTAPAAAPPPELNAQSLLTQQEIEEYGPEFLSVVEKKANEVAQRYLAQFDAKLGQVAGQVASVNTHVAMNARDVMRQELSTKVPNWLELNKDERFIQWLALPDAYSGAIRHDLLKAAWEQNNTPRVLAFFNGFLSEEAAVVPTSEPAPSPSKGKVPLESLAAPGRAKTVAATPAPAEKPTITRQFITEHYAKASAGKYRGREAEYQQAEKAIADAVREGRIR